METATFDIQEQRRAEKRATASGAMTSAAEKKITSLRKQADAAAALVADAETEQFSGYMALENLLEQRAAVLADLGMCRALAQDVQNANAHARHAAQQLISVNRGGDLMQKTSALLTLDSIARTLALAPVIPQLLDEYSATAAELGKQIVAGAEKFKISLPAMTNQYLEAATKGDTRCGRIVAGFAGLLPPPGA